MKEHTIRLSRALIVGHGRDGRCLYDPEAKRELVRLCLQPGTSVAKVALEHGINANLLRKWIGLYHEVGHSDPNRSLALPAFASVLSLGAELSIKPVINVTLPNGVKLELSSVALSDLPLLLNALAELPCSASSQD
jgi:transposase